MAWPMPWPFSVSSTYIRLLGTAATKPSKHRNVSSLVFKHRDLKFLVDAGQGTLRQLIKFQEGLDLDAIFITHGHGDHVWGLPSLVECMALAGRTQPLLLYCTRPTTAILRSLLALTSKKRRFEVLINQVLQGVPLKLRPDTVITPLALDHSFMRTVGYVLLIDVPARIDSDKLAAYGLEGPPVGQLVRTGVCIVDGRTFRLEQLQAAPARQLKIFLGGDTRPVTHHHHYDFMIHQCTMLDQAAVEAERKGHSTVSEAVGQHVLTQRLVLTHIGEQVEAALRKSLPKNVVVARDGDRFEL